MHKNSAANSKNIFIVEHNNLVDQYGFLDPLLGRFKRGIPNTDDLIHLGPSGLNRFVRNFEVSILHKKSSSLIGGMTHPYPSLEPLRPHT